MLRALLIALFLLLAGCATTTEKPVLQLGMASGAEIKKLLWPRPEEGVVPRYFYAGELTGEDNFTRKNNQQGDTRSLIKRLLDFIIGVAPPLMLDRPQSGIVDEAGRVLVTDMGHAAIFVFDENAGKVSLWTKAEGLSNFVSPIGIALGPEGRVFVSDPELAFVAQLDREGHPLQPIGKGQLVRPTGIAYEASSQRIFVCDTGSHQIKIFGLDGQLQATWGERGESSGQFNYPAYIAVRDETLYVSDTLNARVQEFSTKTGSYLSTVGKRGLFFGNMVRPKGVAIDSEQNLYVIESYHDYLLVYNRHGQFLMPIGGTGEGPGEFHLPAGVWVDARNRVFVADMINKRVAVFQFLGGDGESEDR